MPSAPRTCSILVQPAIVATLAALPIFAGAGAQTPRASSEIPYLTVPPFNPAGAPANSGTAPQGNLDALRQRDRDLETLRAEQKKALDTQARLKGEIEAIGNDRRQLNQRLIDTAARTRAVEEQVGNAQDRLKPLDERERSLRQSL